VLEDRLLIWKLRQGSSEALCRIYEKYRDDLLRLAVSLLNETTAAEDVVHDVFVSFIRASRQFRLTGSLRAYLATCVANRARNISRTQRRQQNAPLDEAGRMAADVRQPDQWIACSEELEGIIRVLALLPCEQREAITLHLHGAMKFREIAEFQHVPIQTAVSRYRCGLQRLRSLLNGEVTPCDR
jgi:RNA polymerase sigma-70 factor (ECF subfamily)